MHGLLEIKCPCSPVVDAPIRQYYYDQIQGIAQFMQGLPQNVRAKYPPPTFVDFVQYSPCNDALQVTRYSIDAEYGKHLSAGILRFGKEMRAQQQRKSEGLITRPRQLTYTPAP